MVILAMAILFFSGRDQVERATDFETYYAKTPGVREFVILYLVAQATPLVIVAWRCWKWSRIIDPSWLRRGLVSISLGAMCGMMVSGTRLISVIARWLGSNLDDLNVKASVAFSILGLPMAALGFVLPIWGKHLTRAQNWIIRCGCYRSLYPLWDALRQATPGIVLPVKIPWWSFELRLTRRLAEIHDGRLALRPYMDQTAPKPALQLAQEEHTPESDREAAVEAVRLKSAIVAKATRLECAGHGPAYRHIGDSSGGTGELAWLCKVSRAFAHSPVTPQPPRRHHRVRASR